MIVQQPQAASRAGAPASIDNSASRNRQAARGPLAPAGRVFVHGELWNAVAEEPVAAGAPVEVIAVEGLTLHVRTVVGPLDADGKALATGG